MVMKIINKAKGKENETKTATQVPIIPKDVRLLLKIRTFERRLRRLIKEQIDERFGKNYWKQRIEDNEKLEKVRNKLTENYEKTKTVMERYKERCSEVIYDYLEFSHYAEIIKSLWNTKNGKPFFSKIFSRESDVETYLSYLNCQRNAILGHDRAVIDEHVEKKIDFYIDDLQKYIPPEILDEIPDISTQFSIVEELVEVEAGGIKSQNEKEDQEFSISRQSQPITEEVILKSIPEHTFVTIDHVVKSLNIKEIVEARYVLTKLRILERDGKIEHAIQDGKSYYTKTDSISQETTRLIRDIESGTEIIQKDADLVTNSTEVPKERERTLATTKTPIVIKFRGIEIDAVDCDAIIDLEDQVGKMPLLEKVGWDVLGFAVNDTHVTGISLYFKQISYLPESIGNFKYLREMTLRGNELRKLPESFGNLRSLQKLWLHINKLTSLPSSIGNLTDLEELYVYRNQLTSLPDSIGNLVSLKKFDVRSNRLSSLPETMINLKHLRKLDISLNKITYLPESITRWIADLKRKGCDVKQ